MSIQDQILDSSLDHTVPKQQFFLSSSHPIHVRVRKKNEAFFFCVIKHICGGNGMIKKKSLVLLFPVILTLSSTTLSPPLSTAVSNIILAMVGDAEQ